MELSLREGKRARADVLRIVDYRTAEKEAARKAPQKFRVNQEILWQKRVAEVEEASK